MFLTVLVVSSVSPVLLSISDMGLFPKLNHWLIDWLRLTITNDSLVQPYKEQMSNSYWTKYTATLRNSKHELKATNATSEIKAIHRYMGLSLSKP